MAQTIVGRDETGNPIYGEDTGEREVAGRNANTGRDTNADPSVTPGSPGTNGIGQTYDVAPGASYVQSLKAAPEGYSQVWNKYRNPDDGELVANKNVADYVTNSQGGAFGVPRDQNGTPLVDSVAYDTGASYQPERDLATQLAGRAAIGSPSIAAPGNLASRDATSGVIGPIQNQNVTRAPGAATSLGTNIDRSQDNQLRTAQTGLVSDLQDAAAGRGPSVATDTGRSVANAGLRQALAAQATAGGNAALAGRRAQQIQGDVAGAASRQAALQRASEQTQARGELGTVSTAARGQDIGVAGQQAGLTAATTEANAARQQQQQQVNQAAQNTAYAANAAAENAARLKQADLDTGVSTANAAQANDLAKQQAQLELQQQMAQAEADMKSRGMSDAEISAALQSQFSIQAAVNEDRQNANIADITRNANLRGLNSNISLQNSSKALNYAQTVLASDSRAKTGIKRLSPIERKTNVNKLEYQQLPSSGGGGGGAGAAGLAGLVQNIVKAAASSSGKADDPGHTAEGAPNYASGPTIDADGNVTTGALKMTDAARDAATKDALSMSQARFDADDGKQMADAHYAPALLDEQMKQYHLSPLESELPATGDPYGKAAGNEGQRGLKISIESQPLITPSEYKPLPVATTTPVSPDKSFLERFADGRPITPSSGPALGGIAPAAAASAVGLPKQPKDEASNKLQEAPMASYGQLGERAGTLGGIGGLVSGVIGAISDERGKEHITSDDTKLERKLDEFLSPLNAYEYDYKDPNEQGAGPGRHVSVMAQELRKSDLGKTVTQETNDRGHMMVDYGKAAPVMLASLAMLNKRQEALEALLGKREQSKGSR